MELTYSVGTDAHDLTALVDVLRCGLRAVRLRSVPRERTGPRPEENAEVSPGSILPDEGVKVWRAFPLMSRAHYLTMIVHCRWIHWVPRRGQLHLLPSVPPQARTDIEFAIADHRNVPGPVHGANKPRLPLP